MLRGFETASRLKINFFKRCLIGVNVPNDILEMACNFLIIWGYRLELIREVS